MPAHYLLVNRRAKREEFFNLGAPSNREIPRRRSESSSRWILKFRQPLEPATRTSTAGGQLDANVRVVSPLSFIEKQGCIIVQAAELVVCGRQLTFFERSHRGRQPTKRMCTRRQSKSATGAYRTFEWGANCGSVGRSSKQHDDRSSWQANWLLFIIHSNVPSASKQMSGLSKFSPLAVNFQ